MNYTYLDLLCYLLIYSFLGWVVEVVIVSIRNRQLSNRGFFSLPFCLSYGVAMDILILVLPTMGSHYLSKYVVTLIVSSVVTFLSGCRQTGRSPGTSTAPCGSGALPVPRRGRSPPRTQSASQHIGSDSGCPWWAAPGSEYP